MSNRRKKIDWHDLAPDLLMSLVLLGAVAIAAPHIYRAYYEAPPSVWAAEQTLRGQ